MRQLCDFSRSTRDYPAFFRPPLSRAAKIEMDELLNRKGLQIAAAKTRASLREPAKCPTVGESYSDVILGVAR